MTRSVNQMGVRIHDVEQGSPEWIELRSGLYTGQNADKLLAYASQIKIVNGVASSYAITEITGFGGNFFTRRGHILEDEALELYAATRPTDMRMSLEYLLRSKPSMKPSTSKSIMVRCQE